MKVYLAILFSLTVISIISAIFGGAAYLAGFNFWMVFSIATGVQLVLGGLWNTYVENKIAVEREAVTASYNLAHALQSADLNCAYCNAKNNVSISISRQNSFECTSCNSANKINVVLNTIRVTEPIVKDKVLGEIFDKIREDIPEDKEV